MANPLCPTGCDTALPPVSFSKCAPDWSLSEIEYIYIGKLNASPFADWTQPAEWATRLSQTTVTGNEYIRQLRVVGDKPAATETTATISGNRTIVTDNAHTINVTVDETNPINFEFMRYLGCGGQLKMWFQTRGGKLFGGNSGIDVTLNLKLVLNSGAGELMRFIGTATWSSLYEPEMTVSPIVGSGDVTPPASYNSSVSFGTSASPAPVEGVAATAGAVDADQLFEFNSITPRIGTPQSMSIRVGGIEELTVDFTTDYTGQVFRYTDKIGAVHIGQFTNGNVNF